MKGKAMKNVQALFLPAILVFMPTAAQAAGKMLKGTVKTIDSAQILLTLKDGKDLAVPLAADTMFMRGSAMVGADQVKPGMQVTIALGKDDKTAAHVMIGM